MHEHAHTLERIVFGAVQSKSAISLEQVRDAGSGAADKLRVRLVATEPRLGFIDFVRA